MVWLDKIKKVVFAIFLHFSGFFALLKSHELSFQTFDIIGIDIWIMNKFMYDPALGPRGRFWPVLLICNL
jgi:hypothetical protein